jgi:1,2-phenylacetyl-CoA epoxidase catalytic subunit
MALRIIRDERGHQAFGERIVVELTRTGEYESVKQPIFERWLRQGLLSFGRPGTEAARFAISVGLKRRDAGAVMADFLADIKPAVKACGLRFPPLASIGIDEPPGGLDLSLSGVDETRAEGYWG